MKRFTETTKWRDPWFRRLSPPAKLLWLYLIDNCSSIGLVAVDYEAIKFDMGYAITEKHMAELGDRVQALDLGKYFVPKFISFQYGELSEGCPAHKPIFKALNQHRLQYPDTLALGYQYPSDRVQDQKGKDRDRVGGCRGEGWREKSDDEQFALAQSWLADWKKSGANYTELEMRGAFLALQAGGWMWGKRDITDPRAALERQIQTDRDHKPHEKHSGTNRPGADRNAGTANAKRIGQYDGVGKVV